MLALPPATMLSSEPLSWRRSFLEREATARREGPADMEAALALPSDRLSSRPL